MARPVVWECIICGTRAKDRPPRRCPTCNTPASRWKMLADWEPEPPKNAKPDGVAAPAKSPSADVPAKTA